MPEIHWPSELRKLEREFDGHPPEPSPAEVRAKAAAAQRERERRDARTSMIGAWARLLLVLTVPASLYWWPYPRACGVMLGAYLAAEAWVCVGGLWVMAFTWRARMAITHALAIIVMIGGLGLLAMEILPRVGYARADAGRISWTCRTP